MKKIILLILLVFVSIFLQILFFSSGQFYLENILILSILGISLYMNNRYWESILVMLTGFTFITALFGENYIIHPFVIFSVILIIALLDRYSLFLKNRSLSMKGFVVLLFYLGIIVIYKLDIIFGVGVMGIFLVFSINTLVYLIVNFIVQSISSKNGKSF